MSDFIVMIFAAVQKGEPMTELKPCPFCGAPAVHWEWNGGARVDCSKWTSDGAAVNVHFVGIGARTFEEAAKLWNERKDGNHHEG